MPRKPKNKSITQKETTPKKQKSWISWVSIDVQLKQERFCQIYTSSDIEFFGNGVASYVVAYKVDTTKKNRYKTAVSSASRLLTSVKIIARINELLQDWGFNDVHVDKELSFLITQHADFGTKLWAIREYNKLKKRVDDAMQPILNIDKITISVEK